MKKHLLLLFLFVVASAMASVSPKWIWIDNKDAQNTWACFRKTLDIDNVPSSEVYADIAVDSKYWLWVNGQQVVFEGGLAGSPSQAGKWDRKAKITPSNTWFERVNIQPYLRKGKNVISVLTWYWGRETHKGTYIKKRGGLLFSSEIDGKDISSDSSWKASRHVAYDTTGCTASKMLVQFKVKYDARKNMNEWFMPEYNDAKWSSAVVLGDKGDAPWYNLDERNFPRLTDHGLMDYANKKELDFPFVSNGKPVVCRLPFNKQITPYLEVESEGGDTIFIKTDNSRNSITAQYITCSGKQSFESYSWMNGHDVIYSIPKGVKVLSLKYRWMTVGEMAGKFQIDNPFYQRLWDMCYNTLFVCARDNFMDCPDRERTLWIGDVADQTSYLFYSMDDAGRKLLRTAIISTMCFSENKVIGALGPLRVRELVCQSLQFIAQCIWPYYINTGDKATLSEVYPFVYDYLSLFPMKENGLPEYRKGKSPDTWDWLDWGVKGTIDNEPIQVAFYYMALDKAREMATVLGKSDDVKWYDERMKSIISNYDKCFWQNGFYSSNPAKFKDDRANAIAIVSGVASPDKYQQIVDNILTKNYYSSPHFEWIVEDAMCIAGEYGKALERMKKQYQSQVDNKKMTTLYEKFPDGGSYNHAWNAPNAILAKYISGIYPTKPGWKEFVVKPHLVNFKSIKQTVPSVKGNISLEVSSNENTKIKLTNPDDTEAVVYLPVPDGKTYKYVSLNGQKICTKEKGMSKQVSGVDYIGEETGFIIFRVKPGSWTIEGIL